MTPVPFPEANKIFTAPRDWDEVADGPCGDLHVWDTGENLVSEWKPTLRERIRLIFGGRVRLWVWGRVQIPVGMEVLR